MKKNFVIWYLGRRLHLIAYYLYPIIAGGNKKGDKRYLYIGFLCHQTVEKSLKAYYWHTQKKDPPYTHNLLLLSEKSELDKYAEEKHFLLFNELMPLNVQARYPDDKTLLLKSLNEKRCIDILKRTKGFYSWIKKLLK